MVSGQFSGVSSSDAALLLATLRRPERTLDLDLAGWDWLLRLARASGVLPRLATRLGQLNLLTHVPQPVQPHLSAAVAISAEGERMVRWEVRQLEAVLRDCSPVVVLLKGAAYTMGGWSFARGRRSGDIDLLVPRAALSSVERRLLSADWRFATIGKRDARYYRHWLHELPPLQHAARKTVLDVHHAILPRTDRLQVASHTLLAESRSIAGTSFRVLASEDLVIHSAVHLFRIGRFEGGLDDLWDVDGLVREFAGELGFWERLIERTERWRVTGPLYSALYFARLFFQTPWPYELNCVLDRWKPPRPQRALLDRLVPRAVLPGELDRVDGRRALAIKLLEYWPLPRARVLFSPIYWLKRVGRRDAA